MAAQAIPRRDWLEVEEDLCRTAFMEFLVERWLWEVPLSTGVEESAEGSPSPGGSPRKDRAHRVMAIQALHDFSWFREPDSSASH
jgi:hypothetical protein